VAGVAAVLLGPDGPLEEGQQPVGLGDGLDLGGELYLFRIGFGSIQARGVAELRIGAAGRDPGRERLVLRLPDPGVNEGRALVVVLCAAIDEFQ
jgi:hypothetical protein